VCCVILCCECVHWGAIDCRTLTMMVVMCVGLFSGLCISGCA